MKTPRLKWQPVWVVESWQTETKQGSGCFFPKIGKGISEYAGMWLVFPTDNDVPELVSDSCVFTDPESAFDQLVKEKRDYVKYLTETIDRHNKEIEKIKPI